MITVNEATAIILENAIDFGTEEVSLPRCGGRVLREPMVADRDFPPFARVAMDGIALRHSSFEAGRRRFAVEAVAGAGALPVALGQPDACIEVMTGAVLPPGTDTVVRYEDVEIAGGTATVKVGKVVKGQHVHPRGEERRQGDVLVARGRRLSAAEIGIAATIGNLSLKVARLPRTVVIATGDELVVGGNTPLPHQIRASNVNSIAAVLAGFGLESDSLHLRDEAATVRRELETCLRDYELVILSGGISKGKFDYVPEALTRLGVLEMISRVAQRPAKPFWFGRLPGGPPVFGLPGNPVSAFMCTLRYLAPWLRRCLGLPAFDAVFARLEEEVVYPKPQTYFLQVETRFDSSGLFVARPAPGKGSGDVAGLADSDGFLELPPDADVFPAGASFRYFGYRSSPA